MNTDQDVARAVLAKVAAYDQTLARPDQTMVLAWSEALGELALSDALQAVGAHYRAQTRRAMPADIRKGAVAIANDRRMRQVPAIEWTDPERAVRFAAWLRRQWNVSRGRDDAVSDRDHALALTVPCGWEPCRAGVGRQCVTNGHQRSVPHPTRVDDARKVVA